MNLARFSVNRPVAAGIISIALLVLGLFYRSRLPVSLYPEIALPFVSVTVPFPGADAEQIEARIVKPLEKELAGIRGVKRIIGQVKNGVGIVIIAFTMDTDENQAVAAVRENVSVVRAQFPESVKEPIVKRVDIGATPVLIYGIATKESVEATKKALDDTVVRELQRTVGVNAATVTGVGEERIEIKLRTDDLNALRVAPLDIVQQLSHEVQSIPWGDLQQGGKLISVSRQGHQQTVDYWQKFSLSLGDGRTITLGDVADVALTRDDDVAKVFVDGKESIGLVVTKRADANTLDVVHRVSGIIAAFSQKHPYQFFPIVDQSEYIEENTKEVWIAILAGGAFAVLVILLFLTDVKSALITATALPVSICGSFMFMHWMGFSFNMMSLLALSLAIGLLIDDAVVVREAIFSELEKGHSIRDAAIGGTDRVAAAVMATTLAVIAVFIPVGVMQGVVGQFFKQFGLTIAIAVALSTWVAFTLDPMLSVLFGGQHRPLQGAFWDKWRGLLVRMETSAARLGAWAFRHPLKVIGGSIALLVVSSMLVLSRGADFLAFEDRAQMIVNIQLPIGSDREMTDGVVGQAMAKLQGMEGLLHIYGEAAPRGKENTAEMRVMFVKKNERKTGMLALEAEARKRLLSLPAKVLIMDPPPIEGVGVEAPISVYVYGESFKEIYAETQRMAENLRKIPGLADVRVESQPESPGLSIAIDQDVARLQQTSVNAIETTGRIILSGLEVGQVGADNLPFWVRVANDRKTSEQLFEKTFVPTLRGPVALGSLVKVEEKARPTTIDREKRQRKAVIWATLNHTSSFGSVMGKVQSLVAGVKEPLFAETGGDKELFEEMVSNFTIAVLGSFFFIFVILAIQFENLVRPFVILLTLPLAVIGAFFSLWIAGQNLAMGALIGLVLLIGLAAKNGILLVDAIGKRLAQKEPLAQAVKASVEERFRPIIMTSVAMIFGMLPTALMRGGGSEFRAPMAISIIGGVVSSTALCVLIVPAIFGLWRNKLPATAIVGALGVLGLSGPSKASEDFRSFIKAPITKQTAESEQVQAARAFSSDLQDVAVLSFLGGLHAEYGKDWNKPGYNQSVTIPLPPELGGPVSADSVVIPKQSTAWIVAWTVPLFSMQALRGVKTAQLAGEQADAIARWKREVLLQKQAAQVLQYNLALSQTSYAKTKQDNAARYLTIIKQRLAAGTVAKFALEEAVAAYEAARADGERAQLEAEAIRQGFVQTFGKELPTEGFGFPDFVAAGESTWAPTAVEAMTKNIATRTHMVRVISAGFYPTISVTGAYQKKTYEPESPPGQAVISLKLQWDILDGGTRRRTEAMQMAEIRELEAQKVGIEADLKQSVATLGLRQSAARAGLKAAEAAEKAAQSASLSVDQAFRSGLKTLVDVRNAEESLYRAKVFIAQSRTQLELLGMESMIVSGTWLRYFGE